MGLSTAISFVRVHVSGSLSGKHVRYMAMYLFNRIGTLEYHKKGKRWSLIHIYRTPYQMSMQHPHPGLYPVGDVISLSEGMLGSVRRIFVSAR